MIVFAIVVVAATLAAGLVAVLALLRLRTVRLQLAGLALVAVLLPLAVVLLSGLVMFHTGADVKVLEVAAASATASIVAALILAGSISRRIGELRLTSQEIASGTLSARAPEHGPSELRELARTLNEMAGHLEQLFDARRQLVAWASHDLRTPLASLQAMLEAVEDGIVEPERYLPAMQHQVRTLGTLVDDLFELARLDAGVLTLELGETPVESVVEACVRGLEAEAQARHVHLEARVGEPLPSVWCAPEKVERVLYNLLTNALRHTPSDGSVAVVVEPLADEVRISVEDTGEGLVPQAERRMFERFWRGDDSRTRARGGAGLGLAIAQGLVEAQGGRIWAENRPGGGARVSFTLPAAA